MDEPARLDAEGAAIQRHRRHKRYTDLLFAAGVTPEQIEAAKTADRWRPLLDRMRRAEQLGLDLHPASQSTRQRENRNLPLLARVDAGLAAWNADHDSQDDRDTWRWHEAPVTPEQGLRLG